MALGRAFTLIENSVCSRRPPSRTPTGSPVRCSGDLGVDRLVGPHPHEVDVQQRAPHRVALDLAGQGELAVALDHSSMRVLAPALEDVLQRARRDRHVLGAGVEAVDHGGDEALAAQAAGRGLAGVLAGLGGELHLVHRDVRSVTLGGHSRAVHHAPAGERAPAPSCTGSRAAQLTERRRRGTSAAGQAATGRRRRRGREQRCPRRRRRGPRRSAGRSRGPQRVELLLRWEQRVGDHDLADRWRSSAGRRRGSERSAWVAAT